MADTEEESQDLMVPPVMDGEEFRDLGYLQEVNRRVLHPLGLALYNDQGWTRERVFDVLTKAGVEVDGPDSGFVDNVMSFLVHAGLTREHIGGCLDDRGDPEGWRFAVREDHLDEDIAEFERKRINVESEWYQRSLMRQDALGYIVQEAIHVPGVTDSTPEWLRELDPKKVSHWVIDGEVQDEPLEFEQGNTANHLVVVYYDGSQKVLKDRYGSGDTYVPTCSECHGEKVIQTEWSDKADADPNLAMLKVEGANDGPPDGTVTIHCPKCSAPEGYDPTLAS